MRIAGIPGKEKAGDESVGKTLRTSKGDGEQPISELLGETSLRNSLCRQRAPWLMMLAAATQTHVLVLGPPTGSSLHKCVDSCPPIPIYLSTRPSIRCLLRTRHVLRPALTLGKLPFQAPPFSPLVLPSPCPASLLILVVSVAPPTLLRSPRWVRTR